MSGVIKYTTTNKNVNIQELNDSLSDQHVMTVEPDANAERILKLLSEAEKLKAQLVQSKIDQVAAIEAAIISAKQQTFEEFTTDEKQRLATLKSGVKDAVELFVQKMSAVDALALSVSHDVLERIFSPSSGHAQLVAHMLSFQMQHLRSEMVLGITVSHEDFESEAKLQELTKKHTHTSVIISVNPKLSTGECLIDLKLGQMELSVPQYWQDIQGILKQSAMAEASV